MELNAWSVLRARALLSGGQCGQFLHATGGNELSRSGGLLLPARLRFQCQVACFCSKVNLIRFIGEIAHAL